MEEGVEGSWSTNVCPLKGCIASTRYNCGELRCIRGWERVVTGMGQRVYERVYERARSRGCVGSY